MNLELMKQRSIARNRGKRRAITYTSLVSSHHKSVDFEFIKKIVQGTSTTTNTSYVYMSLGAAHALYVKLQGMFRIRIARRKYISWQSYYTMCRCLTTHEVCKLTNIKCKKATCPQWKGLEDV
jgi:hypothetical protein